MDLDFYQIDAFTNRIFGGNPAGVIPLKTWLNDSVLQQIASENNLSETAFFVMGDEEIELRWFTPVAEVNLCGHATLASAFVLFEELNFKKEIIYFSTKSGILEVSKKEALYELNFPSDDIVQIDTKAYPQLFDIEPIEIWKGKEDVLLIYKNEKQLQQLKPNLVEISKTPFRGVIATAKGEKVDFVSRFFTPQLGINEDPVTGSAHTTLTPYWAEKLNKTSLTARQISKRGGELQCLIKNKRIYIAGKAIRYLKGTITIT